jgi:hypothetical protein
MKKFKVFDEGAYDHDITVEETDEGSVYSLYYSKASHWTFPGELILSAIDNGNRIKFSKKFGSTIDYGDFAYLKILINFIAQFDKHMHCQYEVSECTDQFIV